MTNTPPPPPPWTDPKSDRGGSDDPNRQPGAGSSVAGHQPGGYPATGADQQPGAYQPSDPYQQPNAYQQPGLSHQYSPPPGQPPTPSRVNGLGIASLAVGGLGLLLVFIPIIGLFGAFLAFIGLVLGVIGLFMKGKEKGTAIGGTAVSGVTLLIAVVLFVVYTVGFFTAVDEAIPDEGFPIPVPEAPFAEDGDAPAPGGPGFLDNPAPLGTTVVVAGLGGRDWEITPLSADLDVTEEVQQANEANPDPEAGHQYASLTVQARYVGPDTASPFELQFTFVSDAGRTYTGAIVVMDGQLGGVAELQSDGEATGTVILEVPSDGAENGVWGVSYLFGEPYFFEAQ